ncbi:MAG: hypothetical protein IPJ13_26185 [Saprospiraceae bacterium]|nr:hypothetical protein [Saprospiraceae bacterium]
MDTEDVRKIKKQINIAERDMAKLENEIGLLELKLSDPNFYTDPHFTEVNKNINAAG